MMIIIIKIKSCLNITMFKCYSGKTQNYTLKKSHLVYEIELQTNLTTEKCFHIRNFTIALKLSAIIHVVLAF
jgi:hypothetical protein